MSGADFTKLLRPDKIFLFCGYLVASILPGLLIILLFQRTLFLSLSFGKLLALSAAYVLPLLILNNDIMFDEMEVVQKKPTEHFFASTLRVASVSTGAVLYPAIIFSQLVPLILSFFKISSPLSKLHIFLILTIILEGFFLFTYRRGAKKLLIEALFRRAI